MNLLNSPSPLVAQTSLFESPWTQNSITNPEDSVRRLTIKQLLTADEKRVETGLSFFIDGHLLGKFIIVANVYLNRILLSKKMVAYGFDDGSASITGYSMATGSGHPTFTPFEYAVVVGQLHKRNCGSFVVKVLHMHPVYDPHEIYFHILHVIFDTLRHARGGPRREDWRPYLDCREDNCPMENVMSSLQNISLSANTTRRHTVLPGYHGLSELEKQILLCMADLKAYMEAYGDERVSNGTGVALLQIVNELGSVSPEIDALDLWHAIERLLEEGILKTTIDDKHIDFGGFAQIRDA